MIAKRTTIQNTTWIDIMRPQLEGERDYRHTSIFPLPFHIYFRRLLNRKVEHISDQRLRFGSRWIRPISKVRNLISNKFDNHEEKKCSEECPAHHAMNRKRPVGFSESHIKSNYIYIASYVWKLTVVTRYGRGPEYSPSIGVKSVPSKPTLERDHAIIDPKGNSRPQLPLVSSGTFFPSRP